MRGLVGSMAWSVREGMPWGAGDASLLAGTLPTPKIKDKAKSNVSMPVIKKSEIIRPVERANTETRWNFANKNVRALI